MIRRYEPDRPDADHCRSLRCTRVVDIRAAGQLEHEKGILLTICGFVRTHVHDRVLFE